MARVKCDSLRRRLTAAASLTAAAAAAAAAEAAGNHHNNDLLAYRRTDGRRNDVTFVWTAAAMPRPEPSTDAATLSDSTGPEFVLHYRLTAFGKQQLASAPVVCAEDELQIHDNDFRFHCFLFLK